MKRDFVKVMHKVSTLGQDTSKLVDCSDVIPQAKHLQRNHQSAALPPGKTYRDIETDVSDDLTVFMAYLMGLFLL